VKQAHKGLLLNTGLIVFIGFLLTVISTQPASANDNIDELVAKKWSFSCGNQESTNLYRDLAIIAVRDGLESLKPINPELYKTAIDRTKNGRRIFWDCEIGSTTQANANAFYTNNQGTPYEYDTITLTLHGLNRMLESAQPSNSAKNINSTLASLYHEYLHYLGFDNRSPKEHSNSPFLNLQWPVDVEKDIIVACAAQAFPSTRIVEVRAFLETADTKNKVYEVLSRSRSSCEICARARAASSRVAQISYDHGIMYKAELACQNSRENILAYARRLSHGEWQRVHPPAARVAQN